MKDENIGVDEVLVIGDGENDIDMNVKIHSFYVGCIDDCGS
jgi:hydroxymethylpyrimidine pyrophosphatase-like HAD family hydrolase